MNTRDTNGFDNVNDEVTTEQHNTWELDGGGYRKHDIAELFDGRLYTDRRTLMVAKFKQRTKHFVKAIALVIPFLALLGASLES